MFISSARERIIVAVDHLRVQPVIKYYHKKVQCVEKSYYMSFYYLLWRDLSPDLFSSQVDQTKCTRSCSYIACEVLVCCSQLDAPLGRTPPSKSKGYVGSVFDYCLYTSLISKTEKSSELVATGAAVDFTLAPKGN